MDETCSWSREDFAALYRRHIKLVYQICLLMLKNPADAEDAAHTVFRKLMERQPRLEDPEHQRAWLLKVLANGCKSRLRSRKRHGTVELLDVYPAPDQGSREVLEAVLALPPRERAAVHLFYYEGYSTEEIAAILGQRPGTVRSHLTRARQALRQRLKGEEP